MKKLIIICLFLGQPIIYSQEVYVVNSINEIMIIDLETFGVTPLFQIDAQEAGFITDLAFAPDGRLYAVTNVWTLIEIDLSNQTFIPLAELPTGDPYTALVCNDQKELFTARIFSEELYSFDLETSEINLVETGISTPGDFTFYKGNLVYPNIMNDFIKAYDGTEITNVGCSVPLIWTFVNDFEDCETNNIYAIDQFASIYKYELETADFIEVADVVAETGLLYGGTTTNEYMASACPLEILSEVNCTLSNVQSLSDGFSLMKTVVDEVLDLSGQVQGEVMYTIYNTAGDIVMESDLKELRIGVGQLASGMYFLKLQNLTDHRSWVTKFIKR